MASRTIEDYLKTILMLEFRTRSRTVGTGDIADALAVSPGTVTSMIKTMADAKLVEYRRYEGAVLTRSGRVLAVRMLRRHRLIELFLTQTLKMSWDEVHEEAERMEHDISDRLLERIDDYLGHPKFDPHGDPIPQADGSFADRAEQPLSDCVAGDGFQIVRVMNQEPAFLRYLSDSGLSLHACGRVTASQPEAGIMTVSVGRRSLTIARESALKILVTAEDGT